MLQKILHIWFITVLRPDIGLPLPTTKNLESCNPRAPSVEDAGLTAIVVTEATKDPKNPALHQNERVARTHYRLEITQYREVAFQDRGMQGPLTSSKSSGWPERHSFSSELQTYHSFPVRAPPSPSLAFSKELLVLRSSISDSPENLVSGRPTTSGASHWLLVKCSCTVVW